MIRRFVVAISIASSAAAIPASAIAADGIPQQLQQIQQQLQAIQSALTGQGTSLTQQLEAVQTSLTGQTEQLQSVETTLSGVCKTRKFYLTKQNTFDGLTAPGACAAGYHMASLWEIFDPSNLIYDTTLGLSSGDGAFGPPEFSIGWIRTGGGSGVGQNDTPGERNCGAYTTNDGSTKGTVVALETNWDSGAGVITPWNASTRACDQPVFVWCVQN